MDGPATAIAFDRDREANPERRAVPAQVTLLELERLDFSGAQPIAQVVRPARVVGVRDLRDSQSQQLFLGVPQHLAELRIHVDEAAAVADVRYADRSQLHR